MNHRYLFPVISAVRHNVAAVDVTVTRRHSD